MLWKYLQKICVIYVGFDNNFMSDIRVDYTINSSYYLYIVIKYNDYYYCYFKYLMIYIYNNNNLYYIINEM